MRRQVLSIAVAILLWTAAIPFTPISWLIGEIEGAFLIDRFIAGIALLCALYFQFAIAGRTHPIAISLPNPVAQGSDSYVSNGRMGGAQARQDSSKNSDVAFFYHPKDYYFYIVIEIGALCVAEWGGKYVMLPGMEYVRRAIVLGVVGILWAVGWAVTPRSRKQWAWGHIKTFWFVMVLDLIRDVGFGGGARRRRWAR
ncbi:uncharacterized protein BDR25DRAFT_300019 [Lindgomyces ingoldianus]|uniref:Uncharacterized protein n=1 Tax=Lindgomyces ingoldianus TaxID=673940 RepID=A0ACB6REC7_9PLEO|nr:uncharacterized protein BDR25DRAFT_300019 [Lindgomyces ingoldianus]KAF2476862.1 hypothetical protein BDR25DRAFT_300019 [Lindgomyces ingoldianus]